MMNRRGVFKKVLATCWMLSAGVMHYAYAASPALDAVNGYKDAINDRQQVIVIPDNHSALPKKPSDINRIIPIIGKLKQVFTYLTISDIKPLNINGFYQLNTNSGIIDISTTGEVLLKAKHYLLFNTNNLDLAKPENFIKLIEDNTHLKIIDHNDKGAYNYFLIDKATGITNKNLQNINEIIIGMYVSLDELLAHRGEINGLVLGQQENGNNSTKNNHVMNDQSNDKEKQKQKKLNDAIVWAKHNLTYQTRLKKADGQPLKGTLYVFTDYTCPHCRTLHEHINEFLDNGYSVIYLPLPRKGLNTIVAQNMQKAICATQPLQALNALYSKGLLPDDIKEKSNCTVDVSSYYEWAKEANVTGTPYIIGSNGRTTSGFTTSTSVVDKLGMR
ncbi:MULTISPECIES: thioredoxin fold domain-containing protein [Cysteiniphilum]|uniref:Thioredoxin-like fold domain-containing protein n=1 Tax=Cysteiniphilum litorale TaxID=2056700 RepID=A0A8J3E8M1_9GAMM|nr:MULTISPECIES: thioredoxin fold domain-containing protein [Cysteiniphilum]GGF92578.1 hypothetical protein GCM10010995_07160 [Cysteiniphilum litorale]